MEEKIDLTGDLEQETVSKVAEIITEFSKKMSDLDLNPQQQIGPLMAVVTSIAGNVMGGTMHSKYIFSALSQFHVDLHHWIEIKILEKKICEFKNDFTLHQSKSTH